MVSPQPFGRRVNSQRQDSHPVKSFTGLAASPPPRLGPETETAVIDDDFEQGKRTRKHRFAMPWRPLLLMASLCFGIASFVLPDTVNDAVEWLLYGLMAACLYAGFRRRRTEAES